MLADHSLFTARLFYISNLVVSEAYPCVKGQLQTCILLHLQNRSAGFTRVVQVLYQWAFHFGNNTN